MERWIQDLKYVLMPAGGPVPGHENEYEAAYKCWRDAWVKFRMEIGVKEKLHSDGFVVADEIGALFYQGECVGLSAFTYGTLNKGPMPDLSWFQGWTPEALEGLRKISSNAMIGSQFTVGPKFTGKNHIVRWKEIIFLYTFMRFESSKADVMAGHLNLTRKVDEACGEEFGATILDRNHPFNYYGVELAAQLVAYQKENVSLMKEKKNITSMCDDLWSKLIHISEYPVNVNNTIPFKKAA